MPSAPEELKGAHVAGEELPRGRVTGALGGGDLCHSVARGLYSFSVAVITGRLEVGD